MAEPDWANPQLDGDMQRNCRFFVDTYDCRNEHVLVALNWFAAAVALLSALAISGCLIYSKRIRQGPMLVVEKVVITWVAFLALRFLFIVMALGRTLDDYLIVKMFFQNLPWPVLCVGTYFYTITLITAVSDTGILNEHSTRHRRLGIWLSLAFIALLFLSTTSLILVSAWARTRQRYSLELACYRATKYVYSFYCFMYGLVIWLYGRLLLRLIDQRMTIMNQYAPQARQAVQSLDGFQEMMAKEGSKGLPRDMDVIQHRAERFREGQSRIAIMRRYTAAFGFVFSVVLVIYASLVDIIVVTPWLNIMYQLWINVAPIMIAAAVGLIFCVKFVKHHQAEQIRQGLKGNSSDSRNAQSSLVSDGIASYTALVNNAVHGQAMPMVPEEIQLEPLHAYEDEWQKKV